jgi:hypothetical protein
MHIFVAILVQDLKEKVKTPRPGRRTTHTTGLKLHIDLGWVGPTIKDGEDELLVRLVKFVSRNKRGRFTNGELTDLPDGGSHFQRCDLA